MPLTVIAYKDGVMAADTQLTGSYVSRAQKIVRLPDGGVAGGAGVWTRAYAGLKWLADGGIGEAPDITGACLLIVRADGGLWFADEVFPEYPILDTYAAIGCGSDAAVMAMRLGQSAVDAVQAVTGQDANCGEWVQSLALVPLKALPEIVTYARRVASMKPKAKTRSK